VLWVGGAVAALALTLGANGTLSSWTSAIVTNESNTVATATAVILSESSGSATCTSSANASNTSTCATINTYGGVSVPLSPGSSQQVDVTFTNTGTANAATFSLAPGSCTQTPTAGGTVTAADELTVMVSCSPGSTYASESAWGDLVYVADVPPTVTKLHNASGGDLDTGVSWTCRFTVGLNASASVLSQNIAVSQPLAWTLSA
jgi:hypothetical protein